MKTCTPRRSGAALLIVLVMFAVIAAGTTSVVWNGLAARKYLQRRENGIQAEWLARGGIERAKIQLRGGATQPEWRPLGDRAIVRIIIEDQDRGKAIRAEATYPADETTPAVREVRAMISPK
jgi:type II secretory pathway component PulK